MLNQVIGLIILLILLAVVTINPDQRNRETKHSH